MSRNLAPSGVATTATSHPSPCATRTNSPTRPAGGPPQAITYKTDCGLAGTSPFFHGCPGVFRWQMVISEVVRVSADAKKYKPGPPTVRTATELLDTGCYPCTSERYDPVLVAVNRDTEDGRSSRVRFRSLL